MIDKDNIIALATPAGSGAISIIRISGSKSIEITNSLFKSKDGSKLIDKNPHTITLGKIIDGNRIIDQVLISLFISPKSYTTHSLDASKRKKSSFTLSIRRWTAVLHLETT